MLDELSGSTVLRDSSSMTDEHQHEWSPIEGEIGQYVCTCGASGWRHIASGQIRLHTKKYTQRKASERKTFSDPRRSAWADDRGRLPSLDEWEKLKR